MEKKLSCDFWFQTLRDNKARVAKDRDKKFQSYAGINLAGYHPPGAFAPKCVPSPRAFAQQKMPGVGPINDDVPGAGHLHQLAFKHEKLLTQSSGLKNLAV